MVLVDLGAKQGSLELLTKAGVDLTPFVVSFMLMIIYSEVYAFAWVMFFG